MSVVHTWTQATIVPSTHPARIVKENWRRVGEQSGASILGANVRLCWTHFFAKVRGKHSSAQTITFICLAKKAHPLPCLQAKLQTAFLALEKTWRGWGS